MMRWYNGPNGQISVLQCEMLFIVLYFSKDVTAVSKVISNLFKGKVSFSDL